jgi:predicted metal-dependent HD superfamily phosphohydrolase
VTPRRLDVATLGRKLRAMRRLLDELHRLGAIDADRFHAYVDLDLVRLVAAVPLASEQYAEYVRQVAGWVADRNG